MDSITDMSHWMGDIYGTIKDVDLRYLKLPGSHDTGAFSRSIHTCHLYGQPNSIGDFFERLGKFTVTVFQAGIRCQHGDIRYQLNAGVRVLDLRVVVTDRDNCKLKLHHEGYFPDDDSQDLDKQFEHIKAFLRENPKEFVIIILRAGSGSNIKDEFNKFLGDFWIKIFSKFQTLAVTKDHPAMINLNKKITLSSLMADSSRSNQVLFCVADDLSILTKIPPAKYFWRVNDLIRSTWRGYQSDPGETMDRKNRDLPRDIRNELAGRAEPDVLFMPSEWYMWSVDVADAAKNHAHKRFREFLQDPDTLKQKRNTNIVNIDFADPDICREIAQMNLLCKH